MNDLDGIPGLDTQELENQISVFLNRKFDSEIKPRIQAEAAAGATQALMPLVLGSLALSLVAIGLALVTRK